MTLFPEVLQKAQEEVDRIVGRDRLPDFSDRGDLPYIRALIKELFRWEQVTPTGLSITLRLKRECAQFHFPGDSNSSPLHTRGYVCGLPYTGGCSGDRKSLVRSRLRVVIEGRYN